MGDIGTTTCCEAVSTGASRVDDTQGFVGLHHDWLPHNVALACGVLTAVLSCGVCVTVVVCCCRIGKVQR